MGVSVSIIIYDGHAYLPTTEVADGLYYTNEPFIVSTLAKDDIASSIEVARARGNPQIERLSSEEMKKRGNPTLRATGAKSWKVLVKDGMTWSIHWSEDSVTVNFGVPYKKSAWNWDPSKTITLPIDTPVSELAQLILDDWNSRSVQ